MQRGAERPRLPGLRGVERRGRQRHVEAAPGRGGTVGVDGDHGRGVGPLARRATHVDARADADVVRPGQHHPHARRLQHPLGALRHVEVEGVLGVAGVGGGARRVAGLGAAAPVGHGASDLGPVRGVAPVVAGIQHHDRRTRDRPGAAAGAPRLPPGSARAGGAVAAPARPSGRRTSRRGRACRRWRRPEHAASTRQPAPPRQSPPRRRTATATRAPGARATSWSAWATGAHGPTLARLLWRPEPVGRPAG